MKKCNLLILALLCLMFSIPVSAEFQNPALTDEAGFLSAEEKSQIEELLSGIRDTYNFDVTIFTEDQLSGTDAQSTADDIFDYGGYGAGEEKDGLLLYLSRNPRKYHLTTHGSGIDIFPSNTRLAEVEDAILPYLRKDDYAGAFTAYADTCENILSLPPETDSYDTEDYTQGELFGGILLMGILPALLIGLIVMLIKLHQMKNVRRQDTAADYMKPGSMNLTDSQNIFLYSTVTQTAKPEEPQTHTSSSGETHGGRGGDY